MRVYVPATFGMLEELLADGSVTPRRGWAFAVTPALREFYVEGDDDELADVAFDEASRTSLRLLSAGEEKFPHRRVVIAADVDDSAIEPAPDMGESVVTVSGAVARDAVAAVHVDVEAAEAATAKAIEVVDAADMGDEDAELTVGDCLENPLAWYDAVELPMLVDLL
ncbi:DUF6912 family protein [uncultured Corynebacterium sp.]|uniref:DUF6912 family protein n=1 Tax=uncultured Corynebacterium sp. TaxID=159447 RepID=UPI0025E56CE7|nr:hypothetical protein [uncultured Corynebacterium sp.]